MLAAALFLLQAVTAAPEATPPPAPAAAATTEVPEAPPAQVTTPEKPLGPVVVVTTSLGRIVIGLDREKAPLSVANFLKYVRAGHYDHTIFHRVMPRFMIQGGGYEEDMSEHPTRPPVKNESRNGRSNVRGSVAMARTSTPDSATSQFFINLGDNLRLDGRPGTPGYTVFGEVLEGMEVVDRIAAVPTRPSAASATSRPSRSSSSRCGRPRAGSRRGSREARDTKGRDHLPPLRRRRPRTPAYRPLNALTRSSALDVSSLRMAVSFGRRP